jgi:hypothetical protein
VKESLWRIVQLVGAAPEKGSELTKIRSLGEKYLWMTFGGLTIWCEHCFGCSEELHSKASGALRVIYCFRCCRLQLMNYVEVLEDAWIWGA